MDLRRFWRHIAMTPWKARTAFSPGARAAIGRAVAELEKSHRGEVRFVIEAELTSAQLWANLGSRRRAMQLFATLGVWDTAENTGVLVYVLLADHKVEIVADRGIAAKVDPSEWQAVCVAMQESFRNGHFEKGAIAGITAISSILGKHFPADATNRNELPDQPVML
jgi:uncharacterized membrane protein